MEWSNERVLEFLEAYESEPILWNAALEDHKNRDKTYDAWKRLELVMGGEFSTSEMKKKKESLMASFRACQKKVKDSQRSGTSSEFIYKPSWFAYDKMAHFLRKNNNPKKTLNSENPLPDEEGEDYDLEYKDIVYLHSDPENYNVNRSFENPARVLLTNPSSSNAPSSPFRTALQKKRKISEGEESNSRIDSSYFISKDASVQQKDVCAAYGDLIVARLREMDSNTRDDCMQEMDTVYYKIKKRSTSLQHQNHHYHHPNEKIRQRNLQQ